MFGTTRCGFKKWAISIDDDGNVIVDFQTMAGHVQSQLFDSNPKEWRELAAMFANAADYFEAKQVVAQAERKVERAS